MSDEIDQIRGLLSALESRIVASPNEVALRDFAALELPELISDVTDFLLPQLTPYEGVIYFYLLRHSIIAGGTQYVRVSIPRLRAIVTSARSDSIAGVSEQQVVNCLRQLVDKGVVRKESEPTREGTLYKILIPEEIDSCRIAMKESVKTPDPIPDPKVVADYYNISENRTMIFERDGYQCQYCRKQLTRFTATLDHVKPVSQGGGNEYDNVITACRECNSRKTGKRLGDFLADTNPT